MWSAGVEPMGNLLYEVGGMMAGLQARRKALGHLAALSDTLICKVLEHVPALDLPAFAQASSACRAFAIDEDLWRKHSIDRFGPSVLPKYHISWRATYATTARALRKVVTSPPSVTDAAAAASAANRGVQPNATSNAAGGASGSVNANANSTVNRRHQQRDAYFLEQSNAPMLPKFYSDVLFLKWRCLYARVQDAWLTHSNAIRVHGHTLTRHSFRQHYEAPSIPAIITGLTDRWNARRAWDLRTLMENHGTTRFDVQGYEVPLRDYLIYAHRLSSSDDQAMVLFDPKFVDKSPQLGKDYEVPHIFKDDLFSCLPPEHRPDNKWLIVGPARSGSTFHQDPNFTSAWNTVLVGKKKWILFPPHAPPPGVTPLRDGGGASNIQAPVSVIEWFLSYYETALEYGRKVGAVECICGPGDTMFIPAGWYHVVLNLELTIAITQNYASPVNAIRIAKWLHNRPADISGVKTDKQKIFIARNFSRLLGSARPELVASLIQNDVLRLDELSQNAQRRALEFHSEQQRVHQANMHNRRNQAYADGASGEDGTGDDYTDSEDLQQNATELIQFDNGRANAATDSSSAEDVLLPTIENAATIRANQDSASEVDEVVLSPPRNDSPDESAEGSEKAEEGNTIETTAKDGDERATKKQKMTGNKKALWDSLKSQSDVASKRDAAFTFNFGRNAK